MSIASLSGKAIIPGQYINISREITRNEAGKPIRSIYVITFRSKIFPYKGSPMSDGTFYTGTGYPPDENLSQDQFLGAITRKIEALKNLFSSNDGGWFIIQPQDGSQPLRFQPRVRSMEFPDGGRPTQWVNVADYSVTMEADKIIVGKDEILFDNLSADETWSLEASDDKLRSYRLTHSVSSQQKGAYDVNGNVPDGNAGWQRAKAIVLPQLGIDWTQAYAVNILDLTGWQAYNYTRGQQVDESAGKFQVTETWVLYNDTTNIAPAIHDYKATLRQSADGLFHVSVDGDIQGLQSNDNSTFQVIQSKWDAANKFFNGIVSDNIYNTAVQLSNIALNPTPITRQINKDSINGRISYNVEYDNRRLNLIAGATQENVQITDSGGEDVYAEIPIPGRAAGPILQYMNTIRKRTRSITISATLPAANINSPTFLPPNVDGIVLSLAPVGNQVFLDENQTSWDIDGGRFTRSVRFTYQ